MIIRFVKFIALILLLIAVLLLGAKFNQPIKRIYNKLISHQDHKPAKRNNYNDYINNNYPLKSHLEFPIKVKISDQAYFNELKIKFQENHHLPKMVKIPKGSFKMGCEKHPCHPSQLPMHQVNVAEFEIAITEVTFEQWDICVVMGGCNFFPSNHGWGRDQYPLVNVSWQDMQDQFLPWLNKNSEGGYRLPSEAEWEYAAQSGENGKRFAWGNELPSCETSSPSGAAFGNSPYKTDTVAECPDRTTLPVASFQANNWGLYDISGNVTEFTQDCLNSGNYQGFVSDSSPWQQTRCYLRIIRGGSWSSDSRSLSIRNRRALSKNQPFDRVGFRLARSID